MEKALSAKTNWTRKRGLALFSESLQSVYLHDILRKPGPFSAVNIYSRIAAVSTFFLAVALFYAPLAYGSTRPDMLPRALRPASSRPCWRAPSA